MKNDEQPQGSWKSIIDRFSNIQLDLSRGGGIFIAFIVICTALSIASPQFLSVGNILIVTRQSIFLMIIAFAMTFVISMACIDLSVGSILAICGVVAAHLMLSGIPVWIALIITLLLGTFIGFINGILIARFGLSFVIATLGMMSILRGLVMVITHGVPFFGLQIPSFQYLAQGYIGPIPFPIILTGILLAFCMIIMNKAKLGRYVLSVGSNEQAAGLVGIQIRKVKILVYSMSGLFSAISGILLTSRMEAAMPEAGTGWELDVIAATIIGGTSLSGGKGNLLGTVVGALMMAVVRNGLNLLEVNVFWHQTVIGVIIIIAVAIDRISQTAKIRKKQIAS